MIKLCFGSLDKKLQAGLVEIAPQLGIELDADGISVSVSRGDGLTVTRDGDGVHLTYSRDSEFYRAVSMIGRVLSGASVRQSNRFHMLCYMADMSRNAVFNIKSCKRMIRYLALMGYDSMMLYTEDTYEIPEYPYFGRMRGRFSQAELRELDDYADRFGIELIPCIQALAHLNCIFRWPAFEPLQDVGDILLVGDEKTYQLIDNAIKSCAACFRSRRINLGMDEAHRLGLGRYLIRNGYEKRSDIMLKHLDRVMEICRANGFSPMIWSDMFFRMQFNGGYYVSEGEISPDVMEKVPEGLTLIYWDYYNKSEKLLNHMVHCHKQFDRPVVFAGGAWKWSGFAPHNAKSLSVSEAQIKACLSGGINDMIVTGWGDDGAEASQFSVLPTMLYWAESGYGNEDGLAERSLECFDLAYDDLLKFDLPDVLPGIDPELKVCSPGKYLLYNDPIEGLMDAHVDAATASEAYRRNAEILLAKANDKNFGKIFASLGALCRLMVHKCDFTIRLRKAYLAKDRATLENMARTEIPQMVALLAEFTAAFRAQWYDENKTYGFAVHENRLGGVRERLLSTQARILAYLDGSIDKIEELHEPVLPVGGLANQEGSPYIQHNSWGREVTACVLGHYLG